MKKFIDTRTGEAMFFAASTVKRIRLPKYLVEADKLNKPKVEKLFEIPKVEVVEITRDEMVEYLKENGEKVSNNIGLEKLKVRYESKRQKNGEGV